MLTKVGTNNFTVERSLYRKMLTLRGKFRETIEFDETKIDELIDLLKKAKEEFL